MAMRVERVPIRTTTRLGVGGERHRSLSVYCPFRGKTFAAEDCERCARLVTYTSDPEAEGAHIVCASDEQPEPRAVAMHFGHRVSGRFEELASKTPIGVVMEQSFTCVREDLDLRELKKHLGEQTGQVLPVVSETGALMGIVAADRFSSAIPPPPSSRPELRELFARLLPSTVREVMTVHVVAFPETGRVREALDMMIAERVRYLPVVAANGEVVGLIWDLDIMSWLSRHSRPPPPSTP